jgi:hypothetical protein
LNRIARDTNERGRWKRRPLFSEGRPMAVALLMTDKVELILREAVSNGCYVEHDKSAGTAKWKV